MKNDITRKKNSLVFNLQPCPDWDSFVPWAQELLQCSNICLPNNVDCGADRHMITFTFLQNRFSLNYENYSNSIWIETDEPSAIDKLDALLTTIVTQLPHICGNQSTTTINN
jgi:hypothetical protein